MEIAVKSAVNRSETRARRRPQDDYPSAPVAQRASRAYREQQAPTAVRRPDIRTDTDERASRYSLDEDHLPLTNPEEKVRREDRFPVTKKGRKGRGWPLSRASMMDDAPRWRWSWQTTIMGIIFIVLAAWLVGLLVCSASIAVYNRYTYGPTPTTTVCGIFGHNDSFDHPTCVTVINEHGHLRLYEIAGGDDSKAKFYPSHATLIGDHVDQLPSVLSVLDVNGDGKPDVLIKIGEHLTLKLINTGTDFTLTQ